MIVNETKSIQFSAISTIESPDGQAIPVTYMNASFDANSGLNMNNAIRNPDLYKDHREEADADWEQFQKNVKNSVM